MNAHTLSAHSFHVIFLVAEVSRLAAEQARQRLEEAQAGPQAKWTHGKTSYRHKNVTRELGGSLAVHNLAEYDQSRFKNARPVRTVAIVAKCLVSM